MADNVIKGHEAVAGALLEHGADLIFGVLGNANIFVLDSFRRLGGRYVPAANEGGAVLMGLAYGRCAGKVGVATVTHGPGLCNSITALVEGVKSRIPFVLLCGDTAHTNRESTQNIPQRELVMSIGAGFEEAISPETLLGDIARAFRRAELERRPIALNFPADFQWADVTYEKVTLHRFERRAMVPVSDDLDNAAGMIAAASKPIIVAGRGAISPTGKAALLRLAERTGALLSTTVQARDLFDGEAYNLGIFGTLSTPAAVDEIVASDCVLFFGCSMNAYTTSRGAFIEGKKVIQCDNDPAAISRFVDPDAGLLGETDLVAQALIDLLDMAEIPPSGYRDPALPERLAASTLPLPNTATATTVDFYTALTTIGNAIPRDRVLVNDCGRFVVEGLKVFRIANPQLYYFGIMSGCIGLGLASAVGASFAAPHLPTLLVTGDGGFMNNGLLEFNTAVRQGVDLICVVCNDSAYGMEVAEFTHRDMPHDIALMNWPEFAPVAKALGAQGVTVRNDADLANAVEAIKNRKGPLLIDLKIDTLAMPNPFH
ncbi:thiamine pyrophosphate-binding protein [Sphingomonas sp. MG17]|uniref:Thiamine pyrophosphate-binding protein n=1 Tax=Sphingomonas tagetis TaxID=2949092 RepID=A0A9X2HN89_9SPHN|nr:thiamine pyrophosphate-binding protein [Sphingomonas tagetis]